MAITKSPREIIAEDKTGLLGKHASWERVRLGDVVEIQNGCPFDSKFFNTSSGVPLIRIRDVMAGETETYHDGPFEPEFLVQSGDLLVGMDGDFNCALWMGRQGLLNQRVCRLNPEESFYDKRLLLLALPSYLKAINENTSSVTVKHLSSKTVADIELPLPPRGEQVRIVAKLEELLSDLDAGVAELKAAQAKLAQYRQSLLKAAVDGSLTAEWRKTHKPKESGAELLERILVERRRRWEEKQLAKFNEQGKTPPKGWENTYPQPVKPEMSTLPELPEGWVWASVDQLSNVVRGASPRPAGDPRFFGGDIPWITVGALTADDGMFLDEVDLYVTKAGCDASRYIEAGTLLLTNSGATLGVPKITKIGGCINDGSVALLEVSGTVQTFLYWFLKT